MAPWMGGDVTSGHPRVHMSLSAVFICCFYFEFSHNHAVNRSCVACGFYSAFIVIIVAINQLLLRH